MTKDLGEAANHHPRGTGPTVAAFIGHLLHTAGTELICNSAVHLFSQLADPVHLLCATKPGSENSLNAQKAWILMRGRATN